jgi:hypothetical protein
MGLLWMRVRFILLERAQSPGYYKILEYDGALREVLTAPPPPNMAVSHIDRDFEMTCKPVGAIVTDWSEG